MLDFLTMALKWVVKSPFSSVDISHQGKLSEMGGGRGWGGGDGGVAVPRPGPRGRLGPFSSALSTYPTKASYPPS